jgi:glycosyltransferase involved in cell wall biosynthesis
MRILWLITRYWPVVGGAEIHTRRIIHELARAGHTSAVVSHWDTYRTDWLRGTTVTAPGSVRRYQDDGGIPVIRLGYSLAERLRKVPSAATYYLDVSRAASSLAAMLEQQIIRECGTNWDIVHAVRVGREPLSLAGYRFARRLGVPFVFTPLHHPRWVGRRYATYLDLYRRADALIALTNYERALYADLGVDPERVAVAGVGPVVPESADGERFRAAYGVRGPLIVFLGQKYAYKGYQRLLDASSVVWRQYPDVTFAFIGPRTRASRAIFARAHDPRILETDAMDTQEKGDALAACDVFCLPSEQESFGGVFTEAWSYGKPVIGCAIPAIKEVIGDGIDGLIVPPGDSSALAAALLRLLSDESMRQRLGAAGQTKVAERYSWPRITDTIEATYATTLAHLHQHHESPPK